MKLFVLLLALLLAALALTLPPSAIAERSESINARAGTPMSKCVNSIQAYHPKHARLFLDRRGTTTTQSNQISVGGWVWRDGERMRVVHECTPRGRQVALRVLYEEPETDQLARK